jgi:hypothetical protein
MSKQFKIKGKNRNASIRVPTTRPAARTARFVASAVAKGRNADRVWTAEVDVVSISANGAGFHCDEPCSPGQLVSLLMSMPHDLRRYDYVKKQYKIWGLVQHCHEVTIAGRSTFHVGVALIGRSTPKEYRQDPAATFRVSGIDEDGLWQVTALERPFTPRRKARFWKPIDVTITVITNEGAGGRSEKTVSENISENGSLVITRLPVNVGDAVRFVSLSHDFDSISLVRNRQEGDDGRTRIHVEFIEHDFPVRTLDASRGKTL